jgi:hypothetical protein
MGSLNGIKYKGVKDTRYPLIGKNFPSKSFYTHKEKLQKLIILPFFCDNIESNELGRMV